MYILKYPQITISSSSFVFCCHLVYVCVGEPPRGEIPDTMNRAEDRSKTNRNDRKICLGFFVLLT